MSKPGSHWSNIEDFGILWGMKLLIFVHRFLGRWLLPIFLYPVVAWYLFTNRTARQSSLHYLSRLAAFAPEAKVRADAWHCFRHFLSFAHSMLDRVAAWTGLLDGKQVAFPNRPEVQARLVRNQGVIMIAAHLGCLEVCRALASHHDDVKLNLLVHTKNAQRMNDLLAPLNLQQQLELIEVTDVNPATAILLDSKIKQGEVVVVVGDRVPVSGNKNTVLTNFLGVPARFAQGPLVLAHILKCPVYTLFCLRLADGYHIFCELLAERVVLPRKTRQQELLRYTQIYVDRLEKYCTMTPLQWFNFYPYWREEQMPEPLLE